ncbi:MAG: flagellar motor protein MotB [Desulfoferrobacter sp.]
MLRVAVVFFCALVLMLGCVPMSQYNQAVNQEQTYQALDQRLQAEINSDQVEIQQLQDRLKVTVLNEILFPEGGWELNQKGRETLNKIVPVLKGLTNQRIEINGYTDNVPIGPELKSRFPSNWELSTARATDVVRYLVKEGVNPQLLSATGYGEEDPVASNDTPEGRAKNRRIEIVLVAQNQ